MKRKIYAQCSNCGTHKDIEVGTSRPSNVCKQMYNKGYRAIGSVLYCPECVMSWNERNGVTFDEAYPKLRSVLMMADWFMDNLQEGYYL